MSLNGFTWTGSTKWQAQVKENVQMMHPQFEVNLSVLFPRSCSWLEMTMMTKIFTLIGKPHLGSIIGATKPEWPFHNGNFWCIAENLGLTHHWMGDFKEFLVHFCGWHQSCATRLFCLEGDVWARKAKWASQSSGDWSNRCLWNCRSRSFFGNSIPQQSAVLNTSFYLITDC